MWVWGRGGDKSTCGTGVGEVGNRVHVGVGMARNSVNEDLEEAFAHCNESGMWV